MYIQDEKKFNNIQKLLKNKGGMEITRIATFLNSILNIPIDTSVYPYYLTWQEAYTQMNAIIKSLEGNVGYFVNNFICG
jgi:hypothetical protein